jgi:hypothetical protein
MYTVLLGAEVIIQPPEITTFCIKLDLLFRTQSCTFCNTAIINLTEPISIDICTLHPVVPDHLRTISRSIVPYIEDGAELTHSVVSECLQMVTKHAFTGVRTTQTQYLGSDEPAESRTLPVTLFAIQIADVLPADHDLRREAVDSPPDLRHQPCLSFSQTQVKQNQF